MIITDNDRGLFPHQVPNVVAEEVEKIVDRFSKVSATEQIVQMSLDGGEVSAEHHLGDLHVALRVDDDGSLGVDIQVINLQPDVPVTIEGEDGQNLSCQIVPSVSLMSEYGCLDFSLFPAIFLP